MTRPTQSTRPNAETTWPPHDTINQPYSAIAQDRGLVHPAALPIRKSYFRHAQPALSDARREHRLQSFFVRRNDAARSPPVRLIISSIASSILVWLPLPSPTGT